MYVYTSLRYVIIFINRHRHFTMLINVYFIITDPIFHIATVKNLTIFKLHIPIYISISLSVFCARNSFVVCIFTIALIEIVRPSL